MIPSPEYSPRMLALFVQAREAHAREAGGARCVRAWALRVMAEAELTLAEFDRARAGTLRAVAARVRLWAVFNCFPTEDELRGRNDAA